MTATALRRPARLATCAVGRGSRRARSGRGGRARWPPAADEHCELCGAADRKRSTGTCSTSRREAALCVPGLLDPVRPRRGAAAAHYRLVPDAPAAPRGLRARRAGLGGAAHPGRHGVLLPLHAAGSGASPSTRGRWARPSRSLELEAVARARARRTRCSPSWKRTSRRCWSNRARGATRHWLVPVDECYRLVGLIRIALARADRRRARSGPEIDALLRDRSSTSVLAASGPSADAPASGREHARHGAMTREIAKCGAHTGRRSTRRRTCRASRRATHEGNYEKHGRPPAATAPRPPTRSTGHQPEDREPIDPRMPNLSPA